MYLIQKQVDQFISLVESHDTIILHRHIRPDPDAFGSQLGLKYLIENAYPDKKVYAAGTMTKGLAWMGEMDEISNELYTEALVIVVDTANQPRVDDSRYNNGQVLVKIDHHPLTDSYGDLEMVHPEASSCSEIITQISMVLQDKLPLTQAAAQVLYAGIVGDTGRFLYDSTSKTTFDSAAALIEFGINTEMINDKFNSITLNQAKFQGYVLNNLNISKTGTAHVVIRREDLTTYGITEEETNSVVSLPGTIEGVSAWAIFIEQEGKNPTWRVRVRSKGPVINKVAEKYHGGGHPKASGAKANNSEEMQRLIEDLEQVTAEFKQK